MRNTAPLSSAAHKHLPLPRLKTNAKQPWPHDALISTGWSHTQTSRVFREEAQPEGPSIVDWHGPTSQAKGQPRVQLIGHTPIGTAPDPASRAGEFGFWNPDLQVQRAEWLLDTCTAGRGWKNACWN